MLFRLLTPQFSLVYLWWCFVCMWWGRRSCFNQSFWQHSFDIMDYRELEPEYLDFIKKRKYGTPIVFTKSHTSEDLEAYYAGHEKFLAYCAPGDCACPVSICCWTCLFPYALYSCMNKRKETNAAANAKSGEDTRYVLFPTMIVSLTKGTKELKGRVFPKKEFNFLDHQHLSTETVRNIDSNSR